MMNLFVSLMLLCIFAGGAAKLLDLWLKPATKQKVHSKILDLWYALGDNDPLVVVQAPIRIMTRILDRAYGEKAFSWLAFRRSSSIVALLFAVAVVFSALRSGPPFSAEDLPWRSLPETFRGIEVIARQMETTRPELTAEAKATLQKFLAELKRYDNAENVVAYSIIFFPLILFVALCLNFVSIGFSRRALAEMQNAKSLVTVFSLGLSNVFVSVLIFLFGLSLICVIATPWSWAVVWGLVVCGQNVSWLLAAALTLPGVILALFLSPAWIKLLASVTIVHGTVAIILSAITLLLFPLRNVLRWMLLGFFDRALSSEKGFLIFCGSSFAALGAFAAGLARLFHIQLPFWP